ncbi:capsular biosynthesis protein [Burkholderia gladioli]|uniref:capsular polysaccharide export protein, LipB/KpsS family n=1 Tax=Burkholderia gladioli TaxID=28095 RepID=UPI0016411DCE|nr:capsular biosynthesis protein [Burkholderia gladioli]
MRPLISRLIGGWLRRHAIRQLRRADRTYARPATPAPIAARGAAHLPPLAWLDIPRPASSGPSGMIASIDRLLSDDPAAGTAPELRVLMSRALNADAFHLRKREIALPDALTARPAINHVLLVDEPLRARAGSRATRIGQFRSMVEHAVHTHDDASFWMIRSHDQTGRDWLSEQIALPVTIQWLAPDVSLCALLPHISDVYVVSASEGMAALLAGTPLHVFGTPYYAGWGLTHDAFPQTRRRAQPNLAALFDVVFMRLTRYVDPESHGSGVLDALLACIELQHATAARFAGLPRLSGLKFQWWKRPFATPFLSAGGSQLRWQDGSVPLAVDEYVVLWGARPLDPFAAETPHLRMEDGFLHSDGLGSDMTPPHSQVIDRRGIYFDASAPNDLSDLLNRARFDDAELARASALRHAIVAAGLTKYNLGRRAPSWRAPAQGPIVLVIGQVADDASIRLGTRHVRSADTLLEAVRARVPNAFIVYKPHPDVLSGNRNGLVEAGHIADIVDSQADMISLIEAVDEVHTMSSLAGFDALLRGKTVVTYGVPFYSGWSLTTDVAAPVPWRERSLSLDMLVAGALLRYPVYWDWRLSLYTTPEAVVARLAQKASRPLGPIRGKRARLGKKACRWACNVLRHAWWRFEQRAMQR